MFSALTPYLLGIKLFLLAALLAAATYGGYRLGVDHTTTEWDKDKVVFAQKETAWATEKAAANAAAAQKLADLTKKAMDEQEVLAKKAERAEAKYADTLAKLKANEAAAQHVAEGTAPTDGLWINTVSCVQAHEGTARCRIANADADLLIGLVSLGDERTALLNQCIARINPDTPVAYSLSTTPTQKIKLGTMQ